MNYVVLIPAYQPDERLLLLANELSGQNIPLLVVDDGSTLQNEIFEILEADGVPVLHHTTNLGKGAALKTGIRALAERGYDAVITADADGQHTVGDIRKMLSALGNFPDQLILGVRDLSAMPAKSRIGNSLTKALFSGLYHTKISDTQTGLRAFSLNDKTLPQLLALAGDRYEYEMEMLMYASRIWPAGIREVPIETIYIGRNETSHFHVIKDSFRVYRVLFRTLPRFLGVSLLSFGIDYGLFALLYSLVFHHSTPATILARVVSAGCNYTLNRRLVFREGGSSYNLKNYLLLAAAILTANTALMYLFTEILLLPAALMKVVTEVLLYAVSYGVQSRLASASRGPDSQMKLSRL